MNTQFHYLARGMIVKGKKILLARPIGASHTFLPGGHIGNGEKAETALIREIREELGREATVERFIGAVEAGWEEDGVAHHEINLLFRATVAGIDPSSSPLSLEAHLEFLWSGLHELKSNNLLPEPLVKCLSNRRMRYRAFWGTAFR